MAAIMDNTPYNNLVDGQKEKIWEINETKSLHGFAFRNVLLEAGKKYIFSAKGKVSIESRNASRMLKIYLFKPNPNGGEWTYGRELTFYYDSPDAPKSREITDIPETGEYTIGAYCHPNPPVGNVTVEWYKLEDADAVDVVKTNVSRNKWKYIGLLAGLALVGFVVYKKFFSKKK
jgi:hypothetical protein